MRRKMRILWDFQSITALFRTTKKTKLGPKSQSGSYKRRRIQRGFQTHEIIYVNFVQKVTKTEQIRRAEQFPKPEENPES